MNAKKMTVAAAITSVALQPSTDAPKGRVRRPIARALRTMSIITTISGAASTPLTTAAQ